MDQSRGQRVQPLPVDTRALQEIITTDNAQLLVKVAQQLGKHLSDVELATSQIRNIFGTARRLQADWLRPPWGDDERRRAARRQLVLLKPKLAYQSERIPAVRSLAEWLIPAIDRVVDAPDQFEQYQRFTRFMDFFEAVLAYHTAAGGKQEQRSK